MDFKTIIDRERQMPYYQQLEAFVNHEYQTHTVYPPRQRIFHCFNFKDYEDIKVVIIGQDPYHEEHQPMVWHLVWLKVCLFHRVLLIFIKRHMMMLG